MSQGQDRPQDTAGPGGFDPGNRWEPAPPPTLADATHGRWARFGAQLFHPLAIAAPIATFILLTVLLEPGAGVSGALVVLVAIVVGAARNAPRRAREAFFSSYTSTRGLEQRAEETPPPVTPLLRMGDHRYAERIMSGTLPGGVPGALALYTYAEHRYYDSEGQSRTEAYPFTVAIHSLPDVAERVRELYCEPRFGSHFPDPTEARSRAMNRLELESVALGRRYQIFFGPDDDENWLHQLYAPTFIVWLAERPPWNFGFELSEGYLCAYVPGHYESAAELDALCEASAVVARRLVEEAAE